MTDSNTPKYDPSVNYAEQLTELGLGGFNKAGNFVLGLPGLGGHEAPMPQRFVSAVNPDDHYQQALYQISQLDDEDFLNVIQRALMDRPGCVESARVSPNLDSGSHYRYNFMIDEITHGGNTTPARDVVIKILVGKAER